MVYSNNNWNQNYVDVVTVWQITVWIFALHGLLLLKGPHVAFSKPKLLAVTRLVS